MRRVVLCLLVLLLAWQIHGALFHRRPAQPAIDAADAPAPLTPGGATFVHWLRGQPVPRQQLLAAIQEFEVTSQRPLESFALGSMHLWAYAQWARERLRVPPYGQITSWDRAMLNHVARQDDPAEAIRLLAWARNPDFAKRGPLPQTYLQWSTRLFSPGRGVLHMQTAARYLGLEALKGAVVADLGSGPFQFSRPLVDAVG